ncbi:hypothetical protein [Kribbella deserti]|uniref:Uncharacterized protein n=1 Tax=Kribbella deserti TaxID=1926257 RepID=A0ABV6QHU8_9ACTN
MSKPTDDEAAKLLRETFAEREALLDRDLPSATIHPLPKAKKRPVGTALVAAASVAAVVAGAVYVTGGPEEAGTAGPTPSATAPGKASELPVAPQTNQPQTNQPQTNQPQTNHPQTNRPLGQASQWGQAYAEVIHALLKNRTAGESKIVILDRPVGGSFPGDKGYQLGGPFDQSTKDDVTARIGMLGTISWVREKPVLKDPCAPQPAGLVVITLGGLKLKDGHLEIPASSWEGCLSAQWLTFRLDQGATGWKVTGTVGPQAIS